MTRYIGLDLHKHYAVPAAVDETRTEVLAPRRVRRDEWLPWVLQTLQPTDEVIIEATTHSWHVHDQLEPLVSRVVVVAPQKMRHLKSRKVKTDAGDARELATLLAADVVQKATVWVPPQHVRDLRALTAHYRHLIAQRTKLRNRLQSLALRYQASPPTGDPFRATHRAWWDEFSQHLLDAERLMLRQDLATHDHLCAQLDEVEAELARYSTSQPWVEQMPFLLQIPGIGLKNALTLLGAIGDISRFPSAKKLVSYAGLAPGVHQSGETHRSKRITKEGRKELRWAMTEAAHAAARYHPHWQEQFRRLCQRIGQQKAYVALARKLLVVVWHVLTKQCLDKHARSKKVLTSLLQWSWALNDELRQGLSTAEWLRYHLHRLGLAHEADRFIYGGVTRRIAPPEAVPDLQPTFPALA